mmetsp:Transcript_20500/g.22891  ORF Transcript_20500/g.22891 Transcript_20500/m.22891 type:complete len:80 (-) Transcript_20500:39-278(-)
MGLPVRQWNSWLPGHDAAVAHSNKGTLAIRYGPKVGTPLGVAEGVPDGASMEIADGGSLGCIAVVGASEDASVGASEGA